MKCVSNAVAASRNAGTVFTIRPKLRDRSSFSLMVVFRDAMAAAICVQKGQSNMLEKAARQTA